MTPTNLWTLLDRAREGLAHPDPVPPPAPAWSPTDADISYLQSLIAEWEAWAKWVEVTDPMRSALLAALIDHAPAATRDTLVLALRCLAVESHHRMIRQPAMIEAALADVLDLLTARTAAAREYRSRMATRIALIDQTR